MGTSAIHVRRIGIDTHQEAIAAHPAIVEVAAS